MKKRDEMSKAVCGGYLNERPAPAFGSVGSHSYVRSLLKAMQAREIPAGESGLWQIRKRDVPAYLMLDAGPAWQPCTELLRWTTKSIYQGERELVMADHWHECKTHLEFILKAKGDVLITGLGLGCVVRGLIAHRQTTSITVIERDKAVLRLVGRYLPTRVKLIHADVRDWMTSSYEQYDYAWHDLCQDPDLEDRHLQVTHAEVMYGLEKRIRHQGAWKFPRSFRRIFEAKGLGLQ